MYPQVMPYSQYKTQLEGKIKNIESLPTGLKCNYLVCIAGENGDLIAKGWKRVKPKLESNEYLLVW